MCNDMLRMPDKPACRGIEARPGVMIKVRRASASDTPALLPLVEAYWRHERIAGFLPDRVAAQLEHLLSHSRIGTGWIACMGEVPVGYLLAVYVFSLEHLGLTAEIDEFFVLPPHRGTGAGMQLLGAAEAEFARAGCTNISLQLARNNDAARRFYRLNGYRDRSGYELMDKSADLGRDTRSTRGGDS